MHYNWLGVINTRRNYAFDNACFNLSTSFYLLIVEVQYVTERSLS